MRFRPIDYSGCDPRIATVLQKNLSVLCVVSQYEDWSNKFTVRIVGYACKCNKPYYSEYGVNYRYAKVKPEVYHRIMRAEQAIPILFAHGWKFNSAGNLYVHNDSEKEQICALDFIHFGQRLDRVTNSDSTFPKYILEEGEYEDYVDYVDSEDDEDIAE